MESDSAASLTCNSDVLKESNVQVGIFIGNNDTLSISKVRDASSHPVVKFQILII